MLKPVITTYGWVPPFARGVTRDLRARWAFEEEDIVYDVRLIDWEYSKGSTHRLFQPFGQIPTYSDGEVEIFETGAIVLRIAEIGSKLLPSLPARRMRAIQWLIAALNSIEPWIMRVAAEQASNDSGEPASTDEAGSSMRGDGMTRAGLVGARKDLHHRLVDLDAAIGAKTWLDGDIFTVGDLMMVSVLGNLRNTDAVVSLPSLASYIARAEARPAHTKAMAAQLALYEDADNNL